MGQSDFLSGLVSRYLDKRYWSSLPSSVPFEGPGDDRPDGTDRPGAADLAALLGPPAPPRRSTTLWLDLAAVDEYDERGFNKAGRHRETDGLFDPRGYDVFGYDVRGFDEAGVHRDTGTRFAPDGFSREGLDAEGYDRAGRDAQGFDRAGYDFFGYDRYRRDAEGYDVRGFGVDGVHRETGTRLSPQGYDCWGRDAEGRDRRGFDAAGVHRDTNGRWAPDGYDAHGKDREGRYRWSRAREDG